MSEVKMLNTATVESLLPDSVMMKRGSTQGIADLSQPIPPGIYYVTYNTLNNPMPENDRYGVLEVMKSTFFLLQRITTARHIAWRRSKDQKEYPNEWQIIGSS